MPTSSPELLVVVPYYNRQETINRTVSSILSQTHDNLQLLIVDDASDVPARDVVDPEPRIRFFEMRQNVGRYFIDAVASRANPYEYYMPHDSDDTSVPERVEVLRDKMDCEGLDAVYNLEHRVNLDGTEGIIPAASFHAPMRRDSMVHRANHLALYRKEALLGIGGYHPEFRVGYDTLLINILKMAAKIGLVEEALYIRYKMKDSLTESPATCLSSAYRARVCGQLMCLYGQCFDNPGQTRTIIEGSIAERTRAQMTSEIRRLICEMKW